MQIAIPAEGTRLNSRTRNARTQLILIFLPTHLLQILRSLKTLGSEYLQANLEVTSIHHSVGFITELIKLFTKISYFTTFNKA